MIKAKRTLLFVSFQHLIMDGINFEYFLPNYSLKLGFKCFAGVFGVGVGGGIMTLPDTTQGWEFQT